MTGVDPLLALVGIAICVPISLDCLAHVLFGRCLFRLR
jgi:hypothetical protein